MDETASSILERALKEEGIKVLTSNTVEEISGNGKVKSVRLSDGKRLDVQLVIVAIGVIPNIEPFRGSSLNIEKGIIVNERMETNIKDVYAAGDVTSAYDKILKNYRTIPIWPNAYLQGKVAGNQIVGNDSYRYEGGFMMNSIEVANIPTISIGIIKPPSKEGYEVIKRHDKVSKVYRKIILKDGLIVGTLFLGNIDRAGIITGLLRDGIKVKGFKKELINDSFGLISLPKDLRKERLLKSI
jgi:NAD(P)H-nitrite reductase large subunit